MQNSTQPIIFLDTCGFLNIGHVVTELASLGYEREDAVTKILTGNATFPMRDFLSFSLWEEIPSQNGNQKGGNSYSFWHRQTRGENLDIPMCIALMKYVHQDSKKFPKNIIIKAPFFVNEYASACCLVWVNGRFASLGTEDNDIRSISPDIPWISANHVRRKCT